MIKHRKGERRSRDTIIFYYRKTQFTIPKQDLL